jgi:hypothetical protein
MDHRIQAYTLQGTVKTFGELCGVYICAALTHLNHGVRVDALAFVELLLGKFPILVPSLFPQVVFHREFKAETEIFAVLSKNHGNFNEESEFNNRNNCE